MDKKRYRLYDYAEDYGVVGYYDTIEEARKAKTEWEHDTDGDCDLDIQKWDEEKGKYLDCYE
ncbi:MAG: hypothetical protein E7500_00250 [Ruminococcus sp.]|nr:hypothetical protein [Ruminococcus sp.]